MKKHMKIHMHIQKHIHVICNFFLTVIELAVVYTYVIVQAHTHTHTGRNHFEEVSTMGGVWGEGKK